MWSERKNRSKKVRGGGRSKVLQILESRALQVGVPKY